MTIRLFIYLFRDALKRNYNLRQYYVEIHLEDLADFDESLAEKISKQPLDYLPVFEEAAKEVADELTAPRPEGEEKVEEIQILLSSDGNANSFRGMKVYLIFFILNLFAKHCLIQFRKFSNFTGQFRDYRTIN